MRTKPLHLWLWAAAACCLCLAQPAQAKNLTIKVAVDDTPMLRSAASDGDIVRTAKAGDTFVAVTLVEDFYYLVKDEETGSFLYLESPAVIVIGEALPPKVLISGEMPAAPHDDPSYWQVAPSESNWMEYKSYEGEMRTAAHNGKKYPAKYEFNADYRPRVDGRKLLSDAAKYLGTPYVLGGTTKDGIDCSGLTMVCLANQGVELPHRSSLQALEGRHVRYEELKQGDLIFFRDDKDPRYLSHVGIYAGRGRFLHAGQSIGEVAFTPLSNKYFQEHYGFARRF